MERSLEHFYGLKMKCFYQIFRTSKNEIIFIVVLSPLLFNFLID
jgi:hypothetical protein